MRDTRALTAGLLQLTRPGNAVAAGALTLVGAFVDGGLRATPVALAVAATIFAVGAGNAANDYFDRDIDRVNRPDRPIPSGRVPARTALAFAGALFLGAVVSAATLPAVAVIIAVVNLLALVAYTELFKGLPGVGNAVVAYLTGSTFLFGAAAATGTPGPDVWILFGLAAVATFARELVKDVEDVTGDREEGLRTLPIVAGERATLALAVVVMALGAVASALPYVRGTFGVVYLVLVGPADAVMVGATAWGFRDPGAAQRWLKRGTLLAAAAFVAGRLAVVG